jgi:RNA polymerase sigma-70 factor (ECF subfamily)
MARHATAECLAYHGGGLIDDLELLQRWRAGDRRAGDELFTRHFDAVHRFFRAKLADDVEDLVQRTFLALLESSVRERAIASVRGWLLGTARNLLFERWRGRTAFDPSTSTLAALEPSPSALVTAAGEQRTLSLALRLIPLDQQIVLELFYWEAMSGSEIAACLQEPEGTIRTRLRRARESLADAIAHVAEHPDLLASTLGDLERWLASLKEQVPRKEARRRR